MAKKKRFRTIKNTSPTPKPVVKPNYAPASLKIKAFIVDSFIILMPIMYIAFYLVMDGRDGFAQQKLAGWISILVPLIIIQTLFFYRSQQTPGYKAYNLILTDSHTNEKPSLGIIIFRNCTAILSFFSIFGWLLMFFRKDRKTLHDLLAGTVTIYDNNHQ
ncbi:MAG TPA: RDD family protein [Epsilonproteobacteria bacterium]|nr:RDD family protein [Campylobacterota bacterium]